MRTLVATMVLFLAGCGGGDYGPDDPDTQEPVVEGPHAPTCPRPVAGWVGGPYFVECPPPVICDEDGCREVGE